MKSIAFMSPRHTHVKAVRGDNAHSSLNFLKQEFKISKTDQRNFHPKHYRIHSICIIRNNFYILV